MEATKLSTYDARETFKTYEALAKAMLDAWAVVDESGRVVKANQLFSLLTGMKGKAIIKANSFDECLSLNLNEKPFGIQNILRVGTVSRYDEVSGKSKDHENLVLVIGYYPFLDDQGTTYGGFLLIRDVTAEAGLQGKFTEKSKLSITDKLTGLYNRVHFDAVLPKLIADSKNAPEDSTERNLTVVMFDIDKFKSVNDTYGHQCGDHIIAECGKLMKNSFRKTDIVCRYGGEEFLVLLPGCDLLTGAKIADKIRSKLQNTEISWQNQTIPTTMSGGVSQLDLESGESGEKLVSRADEALYQAKENGRNRIFVDLGNNKSQFTKEADITVDVTKIRV